MCATDLNRVVAYANLGGRPVNREATQEVLRDLLRANDRRVTIEDIQKRVAEHYNIRLAEMQSPRRARAVGWWANTQSQAVSQASGPDANIDCG